MFKKGLVVGAGLLLVAGLMFGRNGWSYVSTSVGKVRQSVKNSVPVKFELDRAREEIERLEPEIRRAMHEIAKEEVKVERLERQVDQSSDELASAKEDIFTLKTALDSGQSKFRFAGRTYTAGQVEDDLSRRFENFRTKEDMTDNLEQILTARRKGLDAARNKLEEMLAAKKRLEIEVANLEAEHKMIEVAKAASDFSFDDSQLSRTRQLIDDIKTRLQIEAKMVNVESTFHDEIPLDAPETSSADISQEITDYFEPAASEYARN